MSLQINCVLKGVGENVLLPGLHRVLWINIERDLIVLIEIPSSLAKGRSPRYHRRWFKRSFTAVAAVENKEWVVIPFHCRPHTALSDEKLRNRYPQRTSPTKNKCRWDAAVIQTRDTHWSWIEQIATFINNNRADAFETDVLTQMVSARVAELRKSKTEVLNALHKVLARGEQKNSLLPDLNRCGAPRARRSPKNVKRLGKKTVEYVSGMTTDPGYTLSDIDREHIRLTHKKFVGEGLSVAEAFALHNGLFFSEGTRIVDGKELPILLPSEKRPSFMQYRYEGSRADDGETAFRLHLADGEWEREFRPKVGSSMDKITAVGQVGVIDATGGKVNWVSSSSPLKATGPGHRIVIHEGLSTVLTGWCVGFEAPSELTAHLAIVNSAMDKVELFRRFNITITADQVPAVFYSKLRADNGELRNFGSMETARANGCSVEYVERRRAERKQQAESGHRGIQALLDDKIHGATHGGYERGKEHSALSASWTWFTYMQSFLRAVIFYNCVQDVSPLLRRHPYRLEMARDNVLPNRAAIFAWCVKNHHVAMPAFEPENLLARLFPEIKAVVKQNGIHLLRPDVGKRKELLYGPRYTGERAMALRWHQGTRDDFIIDLRYNPNDLSRVWYVDELGVHAFDDNSLDVVARRELTLNERLTLMSEEHIRKASSKGMIDQATSDYVFQREAENVVALSAKKKQIAESSERVTKTKLKAGITLNRLEEAATIRASIDPLMRTPMHVSGANEIAKELPSDAAISNPIGEKSNEGTDKINEVVNTKNSIDDSLSDYRANRRTR